MALAQEIQRRGVTGTKTPAALSSLLRERRPGLGASPQLKPSETSDATLSADRNSSTRTFPYSKPLASLRDSRLSYNSALTTFSTTSTLIGRMTAWTAATVVASLGWPLVR